MGGVGHYECPKKRRSTEVAAVKNNGSQSRFVPNSRYFRDLAAMYREIARQASDPHAADSMSGIAAQHQERADELEQWSEPFARSPIAPRT
jgi:hypothetical protein